MLPASYISGACTDEDYRRRGLMGELLVKALRGEYYLGSTISIEECLGSKGVEESSFGVKEHRSEGEFSGVKEYRSEGVKTNVSSADGLSSSLLSEATTPKLLNSPKKSKTMYSEIIVRVVKGIGLALLGLVLM
jgi:hypothetical protein